MKSLFLAIMLIKQIINACTDGCLRCTTEDKCLACEIWANYYLNDGTCVLKNMKNCQLISQSGDCLQCSAAYFFDLSVKSCAPVPADFTIVNCEIYNSDLSCKYCAPKYYSSSGKCLQVDPLIPSCLYYNSKAMCVICDTGLVLSLKGDSCITPPTQDPNCATYGSVTCNKCSDAYLLNPNYYIFKAQNSTGESVDRILNQFLKNLETIPAPVCAPKSVANCKTYREFYKCSECNDGYFLDNTGSCAAYPKPILDSCDVYISDQSCGNCQQGFYLKSPTECAAVVQMANCTKYATNATRTMCVECHPLFYLDLDGTCEPRFYSLNITNCTQYSKTSDKCQNCTTGFMPTDDGRRCLLWPLNCLESDPSTYNSNQLNCKGCANQYFLDLSTKQCKLGSVANCLTFDRYSDTCLQCQSKYYLESGLCYLHSEITGCDAYQPFIKNTCKTCAESYLPFTKSKICSAVNTIAGCINYLNATACNICDEGYKFVNNNCITIPKELNCLKITSADKCLKCKPDFTLNNGICTPLFAFLTTNCLTNNLSTGDVSLASGSCTSCKDGSYPFSYLNHYVCMENSIIPTWTSKNFTNCRQIEYKSNAYSCRKCAYGKFLGPALDCIDACLTNYALNLYIIAASGNGYAMSGELYCAADSTCKIKSVNNHPSGTDLAIGCGACYDGSFPNINPNDDLSIQMNKYDYSTNTTYPVSPVTFLPSVTCMTNSNLAALNTVTTVDGCEYYYKSSSNKYGCIRCKFGFTGTLMDTPDGAGFIRTCTKLSTCDDTVLREGLSKNMRSVVSCHKCTELTKIPFVFIRGGTTYSDTIALKSFSLDASPTKSPTSGGNTVDCLNPTATVSSYQLSNLPANCGIGVINIEADTKTNTDVAKSTGIDRTKIAAFCGACLPGYKIIGKSTDSAAPPVIVKHLVPGCTIIPNCKSSSWFNYCSQCQDNFAYAYLSSTGVQYDNCVEFLPDPFCYAADITDPLNLVCKYCDKGYTPNNDGICVKITAPKCKEGRFINKATFPRIDFNTMLFLQPDGEGCNECEDSYTATQLLVDKLVCTQSSYVAANNFPATTVFIPNCKIYSIDSTTNSVICTVCKTDFIIDWQKKNCYSTSSLKNCAEAYTSTVCNKCTSNYIVISGACELKKILYCNSYIDNKDSTVQVCTQCEDRYYLKVPDCVMGSIKNCKTYTDGPEKCIACMAGYQLVYGSDSKPYCYPIDSSLNCLKLASADLDQGILNCVDCITNQFYFTSLQSNDTKSICMPFQKIDNCIDYNAQQQIPYSTFQCSQCGSNYYFKNGVCQNRTKTIANCISYDPFNDLCQTCSNTTYISTDKSSCIDFPSGIRGCRLYLNSTACMGCKTFFYFNETENKCMTVDSSLIVDNCKYYSKYSKCEVCQEGFALSVNKTCEQVVAKNCLTYANKTACATCSPGSGIKNETGVFNCIPITDINCADFEIMFPFKCNECKEGFILDKTGTCVAVDTPIKGCLAYESQTTCKRCRPELVLVNKISCQTSTELDNIRDLNCIDSSSGTVLQCTSCKGGFLFNNSTCTACSTVGCHLCNPRNQTLCIICKAGYYMDKTGACNVAQYSQINSNSTQNTTNAFIQFALAYVLLLMIVIFK